MMKPSTLARQFRISLDEADELLRIYYFGPVMVITHDRPFPYVSHEYSNSVFAVPDMTAVMALMARGILDIRKRHGGTMWINIASHHANEMEGLNE